MAVSPATAPVGDRIHALLVDDEAEAIDVIATQLERRDDRLRVYTDPDPTDAIERLADGRFDCVISDYGMPGMTGLELLESIRETHPDLPFILFTSRSVEEIGEAAIEAGVTDYLRKTPGTGQYEMLAHQIRHAVARRRAEARLAELGARERSAGIPEEIDHDLRGAIGLARGHLRNAMEAGDGEALDAADRALESVTAILRDAREGADATERVTLEDLAERAWPGEATDGVELRVEDDRVLEADPSRLRSLFRNLFVNAIEHGGASTVRVATLEDGPRSPGFYVEDDGMGIPPGERERVLDAGYSTARDGGGIGLAIVDRIAEENGWDVTVEDGSCGGTRTVFTGVEFADGDR